MSCVPEIAVWNFVHRDKVSYKKSVFPAEQNRPGVARHRVRGKAYQGKIDPKRLVFIDETWVKTNMAPIRGWCAWQAPRACALRPPEDIDIFGRAAL
jgi:hypothetical protein